MRACDAVAVVRRLDGNAVFGNASRRLRAMSVVYDKASSCALAAELDGRAGLRAPCKSLLYCS